MTDYDWVQNQTNRALQSMFDVDTARVKTLEHGWQFHNERTKNWDNFLAVWHAHHTTPYNVPILDAGACRDKKSPSAFLPTMARLGFRNLHGINLDEKGPEFDGGVLYGKGDMTDLVDYQPGFFGFIASLSTIEHGVDVEKFLVEATRLLHRKGKLFVSFDFWETPIDTGGRMAFGAPVRIFNSADVMHMIRYADGIGLGCDIANMTCKDKVVHWLGLDYTFANLLFERR